jgi:hypothetical protein
MIGLITIVTGPTFVRHTSTFFTSTSETTDSSVSSLAEEGMIKFGRFNDDARIAEENRLANESAAKAEADRIEEELKLAEEAANAEAEAARIAEENRLAKESAAEAKAAKIAVRRHAEEAAKVQASETELTRLAKESQFPIESTNDTAEAEGGGTMVEEARIDEEEIVEEALMAEELKLVEEVIEEALIAEELKLAEEVIEEALIAEELKLAEELDEEALMAEELKLVEEVIEEDLIVDILGLHAMKKRFVDFFWFLVSKLVQFIEYLGTNEIARLLTIYTGHALTLLLVHIL